MKNIDMPRAAMGFITCFAVCALLSLVGPLATTNSLAGASLTALFPAAFVTAGLAYFGHIKRKTH